MRLPRLRSSQRERSGNSSGPSDRCRSGEGFVVVRLSVLLGAACRESCFDGLG